MSASLPAFALVSVFIKPVVPLSEEKGKESTVATSSFTEEFQFLSANGRTGALNRPWSVTNFPGRNPTRSRTRPAAVAWPLRFAEGWKEAPPRPGTSLPMSDRLQRPTKFVAFSELK